MIVMIHEYILYLVGGKNPAVIKMGMCWHSHYWTDPTITCVNFANLTELGAGKGLWVYFIEILDGDVS